MYHLFFVFFVIDTKMMPFHVYLKVRLVERGLTSGSLYPLNELLTKVGGGFHPLRLFGLWLHMYVLSAITTAFFGFLSICIYCMSCDSFMLAMHH